MIHKSIATWGAFAALLLSTSACSTQMVRFESPEGATVEYQESKEKISKKIPFLDELNSGSTYDITLKFDIATLRRLGFSETDISRVQNLAGAEFRGRLTVHSGKICSVFRLTTEQVKAALLENKAIYWKFWDENKNVILFFEGFPAGM